MNIGNISMALSQINTKSAVGTAVLGKTIDSVEETGKAVVDMINKSSMEKSVNPFVGSNFEAYA